MKETHPASVRSLLLSALILSSSVFQVQAYYHPEEGRWLSRDPIEEEGGLNLYQYVGNAPAASFDAFGLVTIGFYGFEVWWPGKNQGNQYIHDTIAPRLGAKMFRSASDAAAERWLLQTLDKNKDGIYDPNCGDDRDSIKIFGWSWGGPSAVQLAQRIKRNERFRENQIAVVFAIDPVTTARGNATVPSNVSRFYNAYQTKGQHARPNLHGHRLSVDPGVWASQVDVNPDGRNTVVIDGYRYSVNHVTIVWWCTGLLYALF